MGMLAIGFVGVIRALGSSSSPSSARAMPSVGAAVVPPVPAQPAGLQAEGWVSSSASLHAAPPASAPPVHPPPHIPTLSVNQLPAAPRYLYASPASRSTTSAPVAASASAHTSCADPYYVDDRGLKRFRADCLEASPYTVSGTTP
jgi:hypothetical protein